MKTGKAGDYAFTVPTGVSIDILYAHPDAGAAHLSLLSGQNDQKIHKILFQGAQVASMSDLDVHAELASFERIAVLTAVREDMKDLFTEPDGLDLARFPKIRLTKLSERLDALDSSKEFKFLKVRLMTVQARFGDTK